MRLNHGWWLAGALLAVLALAACSSDSKTKNKANPTTTAITDLTTSLSTAQNYGQFLALMHPNFLQSGETATTNSSVGTVDTTFATAVTLGTTTDVPIDGFEHVLSFTLPAADKVTLDTGGWQDVALFDGGAAMMYDISHEQGQIAAPSVTWSLPAGTYYVRVYTYGPSGTIPITVTGGIAASVPETYLFTGLSDPRWEAVAGTTDLYYLGFLYTDPAGNTQLEQGISFLAPLIVIVEGGAALLYGNQQLAGTFFQLRSGSMYAWNGTDFNTVPDSIQEVDFPGVWGAGLDGTPTVTLTTTDNIGLGNQNPTGGGCTVGVAAGSVALQWDGQGMYQLPGRLGSPGPDCLGLVTGTSFAGTAQIDISGTMVETLLYTFDDTHFQDLGGLVLSSPVYGPTSSLTWSGLVQPATGLAIRLMYGQVRSGTTGQPIQEALSLDPSGTITFTGLNTVPPQADEMMILGASGVFGGTDGLDYVIVEGYEGH